MTTTTGPDLPVEEPDEELVELPTGRARVLGKLPRLPGSPRPQPPLPPTSPPPASPTSPPPLGGPPGPGSGRSSTGSTDPDPPSGPQEGPRRPVEAHPEDFRAAIRQGVDIAFVIGGQAAGTLHARRSGEPRDANRWKPTLAERRRVADPAHRIARRHITNSADAMDAIDIALMAAGVGSYISRAAWDLDQLEDLDANP